MWAPDRLHFNPWGHHTIARSVLNTLGVENALQPSQIEPVSTPSWRSARTSDVAWTRTYLVPCAVRGTNSRAITFCPNAPRPAP